MNSSTTLFPRLLAALTFVAPFASGLAQTPTPAAADEEIVELEKYVVTTGSNLPSAADAVAVPLTIIDATQIESISPQGNLLELLRKGSPLFTGNGNLGGSNSNTGGNSTMGGSQIQIRNLDTLVLINGRRVANSGANGRGSRSFVDVNQIPFAAIERIEIIGDGASAIYGSEAVGGVVNIILKSNFEGVEIGGRYAFSTAEGDYTERSYHLVTGFKTRRGGLMLTLSHSKTDPLLQSDRDYSQVTTRGRTSSISGVVFNTSGSTPAYFLNPTLATPSATNPTGPAATATSMPALVANGTYTAVTGSAQITEVISNTFDLAPYVTLLLANEQKSAIASGTLSLLGQNRLEFFGDVLRSETDTMSQLAAQAPTNPVTVPVGSPYNPLTISVPAMFRYTPAPRRFVNDAGLTRYTAGLRGRVSPHFRWETAYMSSRSTLTLETQNVLYLANVTRGIAGGYDASGNTLAGGRFSRVDTTYGMAASPNFVIQPAFDPFARPEAVDPASLANLLGTAHADFRAELNTLDAKITGDLFPLPAGRVAFALGGELRREKLAGLPDANTDANLWLGATTFKTFSRGRDVSATFAELQIPITGRTFSPPGAHQIDLSLAARRESYDDPKVGRADTPKYTLRWLPFDEQLALRYTYSEAFSAPGLYTLYGPITQGSTASTTIANALGSPFSGQAQRRRGANPNLRPSLSTSRSYGLVLTPKAIPGLRLTATYVDIKQADLLSSAGEVTILQSVNQLGAASPYVDNVALGAFPGEPGATPITQVNQLSNGLASGAFGVNNIYLYDTATNVAGQRVHALDLDLHYKSRPTALGRFDFSTATTFYFDYQYQALAGQPYYEYAGTSTTISGAGAQGTLPGYRVFSTFSWSLKNAELRLAHSYIPGVDDLGAGGNAFATSSSSVRLPVDSFASWDFSASYHFKRTSGSLRSRLLGETKFTVGVNNLTDEMPPASPNAFQDSGADTSTYGAVGRLYFIRATKKF